MALYRRYEIEGERINKFEDRTIEIIQVGELKEKKKNEEGLRDLWDIGRLRRRGERERVRKNI